MEIYGNNVIMAVLTPIGLAVAHWIHWRDNRKTLHRQGSGRQAGTAPHVLVTPEETSWRRPVVLRPDNSSEPQIRLVF
jgi:hypothetical protein